MKRSRIAIRPMDPQVTANRFDQRSAAPQFKQPSSTSTVSLSTASLSTSTTTSDAIHDQLIIVQRSVLGQLQQVYFQAICHFQSTASLAFASFAPWREILFWRSPVAAWVPESHRKGAKDTKGDSHASNSKRVIDCKKSVSSRFHIVLEPTLAKMQQDSHCDKPPASEASGTSLRRLQAIRPHR